MEIISHHPSMPLTTNSITITLNGDLDRSIAYDLTRALLDSNVSRTEVCFLQQSDSKITDVGIVLLMMFLTRAKRKKIQVIFKVYDYGTIRFFDNPPDDYHYIRNIFSSPHFQPGIQASHTCRMPTFPMSIH